VVFTLVKVTVYLALLPPAPHNVGGEVNEESVLQGIKSVLGFGRVYFDHSVNSFRYRVSTTLKS